ncbi:hypothetical protein [Deinococcus aluminii]
MRQVAAALDGHRLPPVPRPLPALAPLLRALPRQNRGLTASPESVRDVELFLPFGGDQPLKDEWLSVPVLAPGGSVFLLEGRVLSVSEDCSSSNQPGWRVVLFQDRI